MMGLAKKQDISDNPYLLPDDENCVLNISGGRTSGYMLHQIVSAYGGKLPDNIQPVFCNTGKERPETLDFLKSLSDELDTKITWLEYRYDRTKKGGRQEPRNISIEVDYITASRNGEPFGQLIQSRSFLPNTVQRTCTYELKKMTVNRYVRRELGWSKYHPVIGFRHDEPWGKAIFQECSKVEKASVFFPLVTAKVTSEDVNTFWAGRDNDLAISSKLGNCDLCFMKQKRQLLDVIRNEPETANWWIKQESAIKKTKASRIRQHEMMQFNKLYGYQDLLNLAKTDMFFGFPNPVEDAPIDCFCSD